MSRNVVIDTGILTLFFSGDARVQPYFRQLDRNKKKGYVTSVNLSELYYKTCEKLGEDVAKLRYHQCRELLEILETSRELSLLAGKEKCHRGGHLSLADCFAVAAARSLNGTLLTTDPELAKIKDIDVKLFDVN
ncbi:MAG: type II toxin-antitoxin system VapC family toxin [Nitrososphaerales archaeon]